MPRHTRPPKRYTRHKARPIGRLRARHERRFVGRLPLMEIRESQTKEKNNES